MMWHASLPHHKTSMHLCPHFDEFLQIGYLVILLLVILLFHLWLPNTSPKGYWKEMVHDQPSWPILNLDKGLHKKRLPSNCPTTCRLSCHLKIDDALWLQFASYKASKTMAYKYHMIIVLPNATFLRSH